MFKFRFTESIILQLLTVFENNRAWYHKLIELLQNKSPFYGSSIHGIKHWKTVGTKWALLVQVHLCGDKSILFCLFLRSCVRMIRSIQTMVCVVQPTKHRSFTDLDDDQFESFFMLSVSNYTDAAKPSCAKLSIHAWMSTA